MNFLFFLINYYRMDAIDVIKWYTDIKSVREYVEWNKIYHLINDQIYGWNEIYMFLREYKSHYIPNIQKMVEGVFFYDQYYILMGYRFRIYEIFGGFAEKNCPQLQKENYIIDRKDPDEMLSMYFKLLIPAVNEIEKRIKCQN
ncbi:MAG: hypothetical protein KAS12_01355 [Candidatus Aenigmarchaeota archaeon]|nr:hypothetical protein [Candidatus Aenigmarchaeota archaeon]